MAAVGGEHAGWVFKQGSLVKNWKKRFMVLRGKQLTYYDTAHLGPKVKEKGSFTVIAAELDSEIQNGLLVHGRGGRVLKLYTANPESTDGWYRAIQDATHGPAVSATAAAVAAAEMADRYSSASGSSGGTTMDLDYEMALRDHLEVAPLADEQVQHAGWLMKEGMRVRNWKRRYFTLRGNTLSYFDSIGTGSAAKGHGTVQRVEVNGERPNTLDIRFSNGRVLRVNADSAVSMQEWLCKLSDAIEAASIEHNNARETMAIRQSLRASIAVTSDVPRPSMPMRHSMAAPPQYRGSMGSNQPALVPSMSYEQSSSTFSYQSSSISSFDEESSRTRKGSPQDYDDSDSDEGDWI